MSEVKRKRSTAKDVLPHNEETFMANVKSDMKKRRAVNPEFAEIDLQREITALPGDTIWVWNKSKAEFHVPPKSFKPEDASNDDIIVFQVNEVLPMDKEVLMTPQFKKCLLNNKLQLVSEADAKKIKADGAKKLKETGKDGKKKGLSPSGLPNSMSAALAYVVQSEDIDELEAFAQEEEREAVILVIEERISELEDSEGSFTD